MGETLALPMNLEGECVRRDAEHGDRDGRAPRNIAYFVVWQFQGFKARIFRGNLTPSPREGVRCVRIFGIQLNVAAIRASESRHSKLEATN
jgi:hypothetical protein